MVRCTNIIRRGTVFGEITIPSEFFGSIWGGNCPRFGLVPEEGVIITIVRELTLTAIGDLNSLSRANCQGHKHQGQSCELGSHHGLRIATQWTNKGSQFDLLFNENKLMTTRKMSKWLQKDGVSGKAWFQPLLKNNNPACAMHQMGLKISLCVWRVFCRETRGKDHTFGAIFLLK